MQSGLFSDIKRFVKCLQRKNYILQIFVLFLLMGCIIRQEFVNQSLLLELQKTQKKVDFRYFNLTRSLEDIHNIRIDTLDGGKRI